jgi:plasmid maintenance system antidote protein VapI
MKLIDLTPLQRRRLAALAGCSEGSLRHSSAGRRGISAHMAIRLERAAKRMGIELHREDMNAGCHTCEFARQCRKKAA